MKSLAAVKVCCRCAKAKSTSEFHRRAKAADGLNPACKDCICSARRRYTAEHPERLAEARRRYDADPELHGRKLERTRRWRVENVKHRADYYRRHYDANRELYAMWKRAWYDANREVVLARQRADVEGSRAKAQRYKESHREVLAERQCRRRAAERAGVEIGEIDLDALWTGYCGICGDELDPSLTAPSLMRKSLDHIWPLALGGDHVQHNLQWSHLRCNIRKGAKPPDI